MANTVCATFVSSPLGQLLLLATERQLLGICGGDELKKNRLYQAAQAVSSAGSLSQPKQSLVQLGFRPKTPVQVNWVEANTHPVLGQTAMQLQEYFEGKRQSFSLPLATDVGSAFDQKVWQSLQQQPYGQTTSYGALALQALGGVQAARAVGAAVGRNPWLVVVPCHRVVGKNGSLTGFSAGLAHKVQLLKLEGVACEGNKA
jgi:methylated-DNA-[protein]-cysteine S-methyltransferase